MKEIIENQVQEVQEKQKNVTEASLLFVNCNYHTSLYYKTNVIDMLLKIERKKRANYI